MSIARDLAWGLRASFSPTSAARRGGMVSDEDLEWLCQEAGIALRWAALPPPHELVVDRLLLVDPALPWRERRWLVAHGIGHVLLHLGNQLECPVEVLRRQERQADDFAGWLLCFGVWRGCGCDGDATSIWELAEEAGIPVDRATMWAMGAGRQVCLECRRNRWGAVEALAGV